MVLRPLPPAGAGGWLLSQCLVTTPWPPGWVGSLLLTCSGRWADSAPLCDSSVTPPVHRPRPSFIRPVCGDLRVTPAALPPDWARIQPGWEGQPLSKAGQCQAPCKHQRRLLRNRGVSSEAEFSGSLGFRGARTSHGLSHPVWQGILTASSITSFPGLSIALERTRIPALPTSPGRRLVQAAAGPWEVLGPVICSQRPRAPQPAW